MKWIRVRDIGRLMAGVLFGSTLMLSSALDARAQDDGAAKIVKSMSDYLTAQKSVTATFDADIEVITTQLQKIQFTSSGQMTMSRPDKLRVTRSGGYSDVELVFDGKTATVLGKHNNTYGEISAAGSVDQLITRLRDELSVAIPGADLLMAGVHDQLMDGVLEAAYIGHGVIDGVECDHLAFRNTDTDWQLWVERGSKPLPRKYVITSKGTTGAPQYTLRIKSWVTDASVSPDTFVFKAPAGAKKVDVKELEEIDEVPSGTVAGAGK